MKIETKEEYTLISSESNSFADFAINFEKEYPKLREKHLIIKLSNKLNITNQDFFVLLGRAELHKQNGTTFIVVYKNADVDALPETFNIVPTLQEAEDVLNMENIERSLGF